MKALITLTLLFGLNTAAFAGGGCCSKGGEKSADKDTDTTEEVSDKQS